MKGFQGKEGHKLEAKRATSKKRTKAINRKDGRDVPINDVRVAADAANSTTGQANTSTAFANGTITSTEAQLGFYEGQMAGYNTNITSANSAGNAAGNAVTTLQNYINANISPASHDHGSSFRAHTVRDPLTERIEGARTIKDLGEAFLELVSEVFDER